MVYFICTFHLISSSGQFIWKFKERILQLNMVFNIWLGLFKNLLIKLQLEHLELGG